MPNIDYEQYLKEKVLERVKLLDLTDEKISLCMRFFVKKLLFLSVFESKETPGSFSKHIELWSLKSSDVDFKTYSRKLMSQYLHASNFQNGNDRLKSIAAIQGILHNPRRYTLVEGVGLSRSDTDKLVTLHKKVSPIVKDFLKNIQQDLEKNRNDISAAYQRRSHFYEGCMKVTCEEVVLKQSFLHIDDEKGRESKFEAAVSLCLAKMSDIVCDTFFSLGKALSLKSRCIDHFLDVIHLCRTYSDEEVSLAPSDWVDSDVLDEVKKINDLLTNRNYYKDFFPGVEQTARNQIHEITSAVIDKILLALEDKSKEQLKKQVSSNKTREHFVTRANASHLGFMACSNGKASELEQKELERKQSGENKKTVRWLDLKQ